MKKIDKKLIMFVGKTHSGKTTFAKELVKENQNIIILEADPIALLMSIDKPIVLSNSNMWKKGRQFVFNLCKKFDYKIIGVYFDYPEDMLFERARKSKRDTDVLRRSKNFDELIINQRTRMEPPNSYDFDKFFVIKSENDLEKTKRELQKILN